MYICEIARDSCYVCFRGLHHSFFSVNTIHVIWLDRSAGVFTCVALAKKGLVVGQLRPSVR